jgi:hypothetical protein
MIAVPNIGAKIYRGGYHFAARLTVPREFDHGTCLPPVLATTSARTRVSSCCTLSPGVPI